MRVTYLQAICAIYPNAAVEMKNPHDFSSIYIQNPEDVDTIDKNTLEQWMVAKNELEPMILLRKERNRLLAECDWVSLRAISTNASVPEVWAIYMQSLRDLPNISQPTLTLTGQLDTTSVNWPVKPEA